MPPLSSRTFAGHGAGSVKPIYRNIMGGFQTKVYDIREDEFTSDIHPTSATVAVVRNFSEIPL